MHNRIGAETICRKRFNRVLNDEEILVFSELEAWRRSDSNGSAFLPPEVVSGEVEVDEDVDVDMWMTMRSGRTNTHCWW